MQLTWPHPGTDWLPILDDAVRVFADIAAEVSKRETLLIVCHDVPTVKSQLRNDTDLGNVIFAQIPSNDTWARDHAPLSVFIDDEPVLLDFCFNGWGMKFAADKDNCITMITAEVTVAPSQVRYMGKIRELLREKLGMECQVKREGEDESR